MAERKVLNKYYPPDFDPAKIPKRRMRKNQQIKVRNMLPMTIRFYFKCKMCSTEITMKTDPQNDHYTVESRAARNCESWCAKEDRGDSMKSLENRTLDSKRVMDILSNLDEIKSMNSRRARVSNDAMLEALRRQQKELEEEDEALIKYKGLKSSQVESNMIHHVHQSQIS
ncbi:coiled-coil domain-containing protein 94 [Tanacetum coccineum]